MLERNRAEAARLVLVTGITGSGKSTALAAMIQHINQNRNANIITIEDPIEFLHRDINCHINQREVGTDTASFAQALRRVLRQDPDISCSARSAISRRSTPRSKRPTPDTSCSRRCTRPTRRRRSTAFCRSIRRTRLGSALPARERAGGGYLLRLVPRSDKPGRVPAAEMQSRSRSRTVFPTWQCAGRDNRVQNLEFVQLRAIDHAPAG